MVEIWQACASGRYNHENDPNTTAELDPNFQYWSRTLANDQGRYRFVTIVPGHYPAAPGWTRPPHIHFLVSAQGYPTLITQMYFSGVAIEDEMVITTLNKKDRILNAIPVQQRNLVVVNFKQINGLALPIGQFDIVLSKLTAVNLSLTPRID